MSSFDNIDHDILLHLLERRIDDPRFIDLIRGMLQAGCLDDWTFERTYSGTPQGGVVSPILANIYLHELDLFMAEMKAGFDQGAKRRANPSYAVLERQIQRLRRRIDAIRTDGADEAEVRECLGRIKAIDRERRKISSVDPMDPDFRRLRYCRYADDFLIGVIGGKEDARQVMSAAQDFLDKRLKLDVSLEKSGITSASKGAPFLGFHVCAFTLRSPGSMARRVRGDGRSLRVRRRPTCGGIKLWVPRERVYAFCRRRRYGNLDTRDGWSRPQFLDSSDVEIVIAFNSELHGLANYYAIADGVKSSLGPLELVVFRSILATFASRHRKTVSWARMHLRKGMDYGVMRLVQGEETLLKLWRLKHLKLEPWYRPAVDRITVGSRLAQSQNDVIARLNVRLCEACGTTEGPFEVHHVRRLKDMLSASFAAWKQSARRRKTMVMCRKCHVAHHAGRNPSRVESRVR